MLRGSPAKFIDRAFELTPGQRKTLESVPAPLLVSMANMAIATLETSGGLTVSVIHRSRAVGLKTTGECSVEVDPLTGQTKVVCKIVVSGPSK